MFRKAWLIGAAAVTMLALSPIARADTITLTGVNGTGVTATISDYSVSTVNGVRQFKFTITNTSVAPGSRGTITNIGFDLLGDRGSFSLVNATNTNYGVLLDLQATAGAQNFTLPGDTFDFVLHSKFLEKGNKDFGGGKVANGILGNGSATFIVSGDFGDLGAEAIARSIFARFQAVNGGDSDVANAPPGAVPEPMTMLLFGSGLAGIAARARRRRAARS